MKTCMAKNSIQNNRRFFFEKTNKNTIKNIKIEMKFKKPHLLCVFFVFTTFQGVWKNQFSAQRSIAAI